MNNLFVAISDVHISLKNIVVSDKVLRQSLNKARELHVPLIIAGDLNDTKAMMRSEWVQSLIVLFKEYEDVKIIIINGNHDLNNKSGMMSSLAFLELLDNTMICHADTLITLDGIKFGLIPYKNKNEDFLTSLDRMRKQGVKNLICHQGFMGAFMGDYAVDESSVEPKELEDFDWVGSGHYHRSQWVGDNIMYFGSPYTVNFGEAGHEKFIWQAYEVDGKVNCQPHTTQVRKHVQVTLESHCKFDMPNLNDEDLLKVIMKGPKEFALSTPEIKHENLTLVPEIIRQSENRISQDIVHKPIQVIEDYLEKATTKFNKEDLKNILFPIIADVLNGAVSSSSKNCKVVSVRAKNFLSYQELEYDYTSKGLTLIEGHDEDHNISTGAGKSSFLDAVCYGLFGKTSKDLKADEVINRQAKRNLFVQVELTTNVGTMLVTRYRKDSEYDNDLSFCYAGQGEATRGKDNRETQKMLEEELGLDFDMFLRSSYFTQFGDIDKFLSASDTEKKRIISEICDTSIYDEMVEAIKEKIKDLVKEKDKKEKEVISKESQLDTTEISIDGYKIKESNFESGKVAQVEILSNKSQAWENRINSSIDSLIEQETQFEKEKEARVAQVAVLLENWDLQEASKLSEIRSNININAEELKGYQTKSEAPLSLNFNAEREVINNKLKIVKNLENEVSKMEFDIQSRNRAMGELRANITTAESKSSETNCLECYQPISQGQIGKHIKTLYGKIEDEMTEITALSNKIATIQTSLSIKDSLEQGLVDIQAKENEHNKLVNESETNHALATNVASTISKLEEDLKNRQANPYLGRDQQIRDEVNPFPQQIKAYEGEKNPFLDQISEEKGRENPYTSLIVETTESVKVIREEYETMLSEKLKLESDIEMVSWWKDAIHIFIKSYLTDSFIEQINELANQKLLQMFDGILSIHISATAEGKKTNKEKITVLIYNKNEECSYNSLSGGERCRICFALNLAISAVTKRNFGFLMFDEILNGLDDVGKSQVMKVFKELESQYGSVFVIDHATEFKSLFTNNIMIRKSKGLSSIVE